MRNEQARIPAALVASVALHLLLARVERALPGPAHKPAPTYGMDFEVISEALPAPAPPSPVAQAVVVPPPAETTPRIKTRVAEPPPPPPEALEESLPAARTREEPPRSEAASVAASPPASTNPPASTSPPAQLAAAPSAGRTLDLSARAAAHTLVAESEAASSSGLSTWDVAEREARAAEMRDYQSEARLAEAVPTLSRVGHDPSVIVHGIQDVNSLIAKPWDLILRPLRGARYNYRGTGFDAIIRADGSVQYRSKSGVQFMGGTGKEIDGQPIPTAGLGFRDALMDKMLGRDAHASERRRFLEQTRALRELLYERGMRAALARADVHLKQRLALIELRLSGGNAERARAELFTLWDECAEDEVGAKARARIEQFVREHLEPDSGDTFSTTELVTLNHKRHSQKPFAPYTRSSDAGLAPAGLDAAPP